MCDYILDTNILIYLLNKESKYIQYIQALDKEVLGISIISYMETLVGTNSNEEYAQTKSFLDNFTIINLNENIALQAIKFLRTRDKKSLRDPKLADIFIASTALTCGVPLITNNAKDFSFFDTLKVLKVP